MLEGLQQQPLWGPRTASARAKKASRWRTRGRGCALRGCSTLESPATFSKLKSKTTSPLATGCTTKEGISSEWHMTMAQWHCPKTFEGLRTRSRGLSSKNVQLEQVMVWCPAAEVFKVLFGCTKQKAKSSLQCSTGQRTPGQTASSFAAPAKEGRAASSEQRRNGLHRTAARHALVDFLFDSQAYKLLVQSLFVQVYHLRQIQEVPLWFCNLSKGGPTHAHQCFGQGWQKATNLSVQFFQAFTKGLQVVEAFMRQQSLDCELDAKRVMGVQGLNELRDFFMSTVFLPWAKVLQEVNQKLALRGASSSVAWKLLASNATFICWAISSAHSCPWTKDKRTVYK